MAFFITGRHLVAINGSGNHWENALYRLKVHYSHLARTDKTPHTDGSHPHKVIVGMPYMAARCPFALSIESITSKLEIKANSSWNASLPANAGTSIVFLCEIIKLGLFCLSSTKKKYLIISGIIQIIYDRFHKVSRGYIFFPHVPRKGGHSNPFLGSSTNYGQRLVR